MTPQRIVEAILTTATKDYVAPKPGRKPKPGKHRYDITLTLYEAMDDDLIAYLESMKEAGVSYAQAILTAMRGGLPKSLMTTDADEQAELEGLLADL
jgi:hypothetical protein